MLHFRGQRSYLADKTSRPSAVCMQWIVHDTELSTLGAIFWYRFLTGTKKVWEKWRRMGRPYMQIALQQSGVNDLQELFAAFNGGCSLHERRRCRRVRVIQLLHKMAPFLCRRGKKGVIHTYFHSGLHSHYCTSLFQTNFLDSHIYNIFLIKHMGFS